MLRTLLVFGLIVASGILFMHLTAAGTRGISTPVTPAADREVVPAKVFLTLSSPASEIVMESAGVSIDFPANDSGLHSGELAIDPGSPVVFLRVVWQEQNAGNRFVKLVVEAPGQETFTHIFDATGDVCDFVELPF